MDRLPLDHRGEGEAPGARALLGVQGELPLDHQGEGEAPGREDLEAGMQVAIISVYF